MAPSPHKKAALALVNGLTLSRLIAGIVSVLIFYSQAFKPYLALSFLYILISDLSDGFLARRLAVATRAGSIFDYVVDRFNFYLAIGVLIGEGVSVLVFLPFLLRDLIYVFVQTYVSISSIRGTKAASFGGTLSTYAYVLIINYLGKRNWLLDLLLTVMFVISLANLSLRV